MERKNIIKERPKPPTKFDLTPKAYYEHNIYFNESEKYINYLENELEGNKNFKALNEILELYIKLNKQWLNSNKSDKIFQDILLTLSKEVYKILINRFPKTMGVKNK